MASEAQVSRIRALAKGGGLDHEALLDLAEEVSGSSVIDLKDLNSVDASDLIDRLEGG